MALLDTLPTLPPADPPALIVHAQRPAAATIPPVLIAMASTDAAASYQGDTLVVDGVAYPRDGSNSASRSYAPGRLLVSPQPGRGGEIAALMLRLGLTVERALGGDPPIGWVISVPEGYELQWQAALKRQPAVAGADIDGRMSPQPARQGTLQIGPGMVR
ncbi:MAG: hypothetical protein RIQ60_4023 [Pseudomonadota bacterium]|jgi:hypothetical protein